MSVLGSSSPLPAADRTRTSTTSSPGTTGLAFLVHSPETVQANLPPDVDNKPLARQKRRRTSKEDEDILKAEYKRNPKPDKAARLEIVSRVALGEKEVQIWFQNKRQNDRRKSRPPQSFDIIPQHQPAPPRTITTDDTDSLGPSSQADDMSFALTAARRGSEQGSLVPGASSDDHDSQLVEAAQPPTTGGAADMVITSTATTTSNMSKASFQSATMPLNSAAELPSSDTAPTEPGSSQPFFSSQESTLSQDSSRPGYLANRRSASFVRMDESELSGGSVVPLAPAEPQPSHRSLKRTHSYVRLSMTVDGKARVITDADQSPSPPRPQQGSGKFSARGLRRSFSAAGFNEKLRQSGVGEPLPKMKRTSTVGRSRDSRAWEFWCDSEARNSLMEKADQERSGSAADAIGLIRAHSRGALAANANKRNVQLRRTSPGPRSKVTKVGLSRSSTSQGRLQSRTPSVVKQIEDAFSTPKKSDKGEDEGYGTPTTDSDKENWEPEVQGQGARRRQIEASSKLQTPRRILGENTTIMSQSNSLGALMARDKRRKSQMIQPDENSENVYPEDDEEIAAFMGSGVGNKRTSVDVSSGEEMGCVEGLLKLSQGAWR